jgi:addiction module RelB/DinJ family antitoxin
MLAAMGLSVSDAVHIFLMRVVAEKQMPFTLKGPNAETRTAMTLETFIACWKDNDLSERQKRFVWMISYFRRSARYYAVCLKTRKNAIRQNPCSDYGRSRPAIRGID